MSDLPRDSARKRNALCPHGFHVLKSVSYLYCQMVSYISSDFGPLPAGKLFPEVRAERIGGYASMDKHPGPEKSGVL